jgi:hypothetical protein
MMHHARTSTTTLVLCIHDSLSAGLIHDLDVIMIPENRSHVAPSERRVSPTQQHLGVPQLTVAASFSTSCGPPTSPRSKMASESD